MHTASHTQLCTGKPFKYMHWTATSSAAAAGQRDSAAEPDRILCEKHGLQHALLVGRCGGARSRERRRISQPPLQHRSWRVPCSPYRVRPAPSPFPRHCCRRFAVVACLWGKPLILTVAHATWGKPRPLIVACATWMFMCAPQSFGAAPAPSPLPPRRPPLPPAPATWAMLLPRHAMGKPPSRTVHLDL
jgi:hypothetical protein